MYLFGLFAVFSFPEKIHTFFDFYYENFIRRKWLQINFTKKT